MTVMTSAFQSSILYIVPTHWPEMDVYILKYNAGIFILIFFLLKDIPPRECLCQFRIKTEFEMVVGGACL